MEVFGGVCGPPCGCTEHHPVSRWWVSRESPAVITRISCTISTYFDSDTRLAGHTTLHTKLPPSCNAHAVRIVIARTRRCFGCIKPHIPFWTQVAVSLTGRNCRGPLTLALPIIHNSTHNVRSLQLRSGVHARIIDTCVFRLQIHVE